VTLSDRYLTCKGACGESRNMAWTVETFLVVWMLFGSVFQQTNQAWCAPPEDAIGRELAQSMIWLDSAPFGREAYAVFRRQVPLSAAPKQAVLRIFADSRYVLWINGLYVERGPCRFVPSHPEYDTLDVTSFLQQGDNALAVVVHHYHDGVMKDDGSEVNGRVARHAPGFTAMLEFTEHDGAHRRISTDTSWRGNTRSRFGPSGVAPSSIPDQIDARRDSGDWAMAGFDDSGWEKPVPLDGRKWGPLVARRIPLLRETEVKPLTVVEHEKRAMHRPLAEMLPIELKPGQALVIDAGQFVQAYSIIDMETEAGSELELEYAQTFFDTDRKPGGSYDHVNQYIARAGRQTYMSLDTFGCKYVVARVKSGRARLLDVRLVNRLYPFEVVGRFQSSDAFLNKLWLIGVETVRICSEDAYVDSASRERAGWLADATVVEGPITRLVFAAPGANGRPYYADPRLLRQTLWQVGNCVVRDGRVKAFAPSDGFDQHGYIEDFACLWIQGIRTYCDMTGDLDLARELWPAVTGQIKWFLDRLSPRGLVHAREFVFPGNPLVYEVCEGATLNAYFYRALADAAELARLLDKPETQREHDVAAKALKAAINKHLWDDDAGTYSGGIRDARHVAPTVYAAMMCLYFGVVPSEREERVARWLLANHEMEPFSPYACMFLFECLYSIDTPAADRLVLDLMRRRWAEMVRGETKTAWENFHRGEYCHNMGSTPAYHLSRRVLGVGVDGPVRDRRIVIEPRLADLRRVDGTVVTELGPVPVLWEKADNGRRLSFQVEIPDRVTARLHLPRIGDSPVVVINGQTTKPTAQGRFLASELGPGKHAGFVEVRETAQSQGSTSSGG
jgi:alpha-L-rhamnosidase